MKKVIMFVATLICAVATQAASINWNSGTIQIDGATVGKGDVNGYLYLVTEDEYNALDFSDGKAAYDNYKAKTATATAASTKTGTIKLTSTANVGDTQYAVIIYETSDASQFIISKGYDSVNDLGVQNNLGSQNIITAPGATSWASTSGGGDVPEPTSGILLLVGGAMLALRRKQK